MVRVAYKRIYLLLIKISGALDVLQSEDNNLLRAGVIGGAALVGLGFGAVRGG